MGIFKIFQESNITLLDHLHISFYTIIRTLGLLNSMTLFGYRLFFLFFSNKNEQAAAHISEVKTTRKAVEPKYKIVQEPVQGHPDFLVAEVRL